MNQPSQLQLRFLPLSEGILTALFTGQSSKDDVVLFKEALEGHFQQSTKIEKAIFDLTEIDPIMNAAGRLLDLACLCRTEHQILVEVRMSEEIYTALQEVTPQEMPKPPITSANVRGVTVVVAKKVQQISAVRALHPQAGFGYKLLPRSKVVLSCGGTVRAINASVVTVSLEIDGEEIIGEFERDQFPKPVSPGMVFDYEAVVTAPGKTEIRIDFVTPQYPTVEELEDISTQVAHDIGLKKQHSRTKN